MHISCMYQYNRYGLPLILVGFCFSASSIENIGKAVLFRPLCVHWLGVHAIVGRLSNNYREINPGCFDPLHLCIL